MTKQPKRDTFTSLYVDRHGKERCVFRRKGVTRQLPHPSAPGYKEAYDAAVAGTASPTIAERVIPRSVGDLVSRFYRTTTFLNAGEARQATVRGLIEPFRRRYGTVQVSTFQFDDIERILVVKSKKRQSGKRIVGGKVASKNLQKQLKRLFRLAVKLKWVTANPVELADGVKQVKTGGFHSWSEPEISQYRARHPLGTKARLYAEIILWTWQRRGDAHRFGPKQMKGERIQYTQAKGGKTLWLPAAPQLISAIQAMPAIGIETFLVTDFGKPFTKDGIGNKMREWCDEAGLPQCTAHGLRKAGARRVAELEGTNQQLKAVGGWSNDAEVSTYTQAAEQARLAESALRRVIEWELSNPPQEG